jgi:hypothetical protein
MVRAGVRAWPPSLLARQPMDELDALWWAPVLRAVLTELRMVAIAYTAAQRASADRADGEAGAGAGGDDDDDRLPLEMVAQVLQKAFRSLIMIRYTAAATCRCPLRPHSPPPITCGGRQSGPGGAHYEATYPFCCQRAVPVQFSRTAALLGKVVGAGGTSADRRWHVCRHGAWARRRQTNKTATAERLQGTVEGELHDTRLSRRLLPRDDYALYMYYTARMAANANRFEEVCRAAGRGRMSLHLIPDGGMGHILSLSLSLS